MTKLTAAQRKTRSLKRTAGSVFYVSAAMTVAANIYASQHTLIGGMIGFWIPLAFFFILELLERVPSKGRTGVARKIAIIFLAGIAGWTSYWHLVEVLRDGGVHDPVTLYLAPLTVDVLMAIAREAMKAKTASPARRRTAARKAATVTKLRAA